MAASYRAAALRGNNQSRNLPRKKRIRLAS